MKPPCPSCGNLGLVPPGISCPRGCPDVRGQVEWPPFLKTTRNAVPDGEGGLWVPFHLNSGDDDLLVYFPFVTGDHGGDVEEVSFRLWNAREGRPVLLSRTSRFVPTPWINLFTSRG